MEYAPTDRPLISIVTPAFNEQENLRTLYDQLLQVLDRLTASWEWIIVDDHSSDRTFEMAQYLADVDPRVRGLRLARNSGSHLALSCGLQHVQGDCAIVLAADLQDPPSTIVDLVATWRSGAQVVWAARRRREGEDALKIGLSRLYYFLMRQVVGMREMPASGADFFLLDRAVVDALKQFRETNVSLLALLTWMGFRQERIYYDKQPRLHGASGWTLKKKLKLLVDSVTAFSYVPIRLMGYVGFGVALLGFAYAGVVVVNALAGSPPSGWSSLMVVILVIGGIQMIMMGALGEYLWRALDEARRRPRFLIEAVTGSQVELQHTLVSTESVESET